MSEVIKTGDVFYSFFFSFIESAAYVGEMERQWMILNVDEENTEIVLFKCFINGCPIPDLGRRETQTVKIDDFLNNHSRDKERARKIGIDEHLKRLSPDQLEKYSKMLADKEKSRKIAREKFCENFFEIAEALKNKK